MLKIYGQPRSRAFRVLWLAKEANIPYEHIPVSIMADKLECKEPWYVELNPNARIPVPLPTLPSITGPDAAFERAAKTCSAWT